MYSSRPQSDYSKPRNHSENRPRHYREQPRREMEQRPRYDSSVQRTPASEAGRREMEQQRPNRREPEQNRRKETVPTADQINKLVQHVFEPYDPENWSVLDERDQHTIRKIIYHTPLIDLSIRRVLQVSRLLETPSTIAFISECIGRKFNSLPQ
jgi:hypothetical protein